MALALPSPQSSPIHPLRSSHNLMLMQEDGPFALRRCLPNADAGLATRVRQVLSDNRTRCSLPRIEVNGHRLLISEGKVTESKSTSPHTPETHLAPDSDEHWEEDDEPSLGKLHRISIRAAQSRMEDIAKASSKPMETITWARTALPPNLSFPSVVSRSSESTILPPRHSTLCRRTSLLIQQLQQPYTARLFQRSRLSTVSALRGPDL